MTPISSKCETILKDALAHLAGETSPLEKARFMSHMERCASCNAAVSQMTDMLDAARKSQDVPSVTAKDRMFDGVMARIEKASSASVAEVFVGESRRRLTMPRGRTIAAAAMVLVSMSVLFAVFHMRQDDAPASWAPSVPSSTILSAESSTTMATFSTVRLFPHLTIGVSADALWRLAETDALQRILVERGELWIWYDKTLGKKRLEIEGSGAVATVVGTVLTVKAEPGKVMEVGVLEGRVAVRSNLGTHRFLEKGDWLSAEGHLVPMSETIAKTGRHWLETVSEKQNTAQAAGPDFSSRNTDGPTPDTVETDAPKPVKRDIVDAPGLYSQAEKEMQSGNYSEAATILERLVRKASRSTEADTARLDLAGLYTRRLANPQRAAKHLSDYLRRHPNGARAGLVKRRLCRISADFGIAVDISCD